MMRLRRRRTAASAAAAAVGAAADDEATAAAGDFDTAAGNSGRLAQSGVISVQRGYEHRRHGTFLDRRFCGEEIVVVVIVILVVVVVKSHLAFYVSNRTFRIKSFVFL